MAHLFRAFSNGIDGVYIGGCRLNECNYVTHGNYHALNMVLLVKGIMNYVGLDPERLKIQFMSGAEAGPFVESVNNFVRDIKEMGPIGRGKKEESTGKQFKSKLAEVTKLIPYIKRIKNDKLGTPLHNPKEYDNYFTKDEIEKLFDEVVSYYIDPEKCQACMICARRCPAEAIISAKGQIHVIDQGKCIKCNTCYEVCPEKFGAVTRIVSSPIPDPIPLEARVITRG
jgi:F420-non-reducing hydrogenase iron-sulfur subunit